MVALSTLVSFEISYRNFYLVYIDKGFLGYYS